MSFIKVNPKPSKRKRYLILSTNLGLQVASYVGVDEDGDHQFRTNLGVMDAILCSAIWVDVTDLENAMKAAVRKETT